MADVTLNGGASGSNIALSGSDALFQVTDGEVEFSGDGATYIKVSSGNEIVFYDGTTVRVRNTRPVAAAFSYTDY